MREQAIALLGQILQNNIGNRLTEEMATGIATTLNHHLMLVEVKPMEVGEQQQPSSSARKKAR